MQRLKRLFKKSPWLVMAAALHLIGLAVALVLVPHRSDEVVEEVRMSVALARPKVEETPLPPPELIDRKAIQNHEQAELVTYEEDIYIPTEAIQEDLYQERGDPNSLDEMPMTPGAEGGTAIGVGSKGHGGRTSAFSSRRQGSGFGKGRPGGATQGTEQAVLEGLRWLARHQNEDGSWGATTIANHCTTTPPCVPRDSDLGTRFDTGTTSMCLLAFLGQGISVDSKIELVDTAMGKRHYAGTIVRDGLKWLLERQKKDGSFSSEETFQFPENDTLSTMAVCEAYGLSKARMLKEPTERALGFLIAAQKRDPNGVRTGWGAGSYTHLKAKLDSGELDPRDFDAAMLDVNQSVTCWVVMALQSAQLCGLEVPPDVLPAALNYVLLTTTVNDPKPLILDDTDKFVFHPARNQAVAMLTRTFAGGDISDPYMADGAKDLAADLPMLGKDGLSVDFYYWYFATIALNQYDGPDSPLGAKGKAWGRWNSALVDTLLPMQDASKEKNRCSRGAWLQPSRGNRKGLELRNTAMNIMTLEVYYRFGNVFGANRKRP